MFALSLCLPLLLGCSTGLIPTDAISDPPAAVAATPGNAQVVLSWSPSISAVTYNIYFANASGVTPASPNKIVGIAATTYTQTPVTHGIPYFYIVTAVNNDGESRPSAQASANP